MKCKECPDRSTGCHASCIDYLEYRMKKENAKKNRNEYYITPRAGFIINMKKRMRSNKSFGNMKIN